MRCISLLYLIKEIIQHGKYIMISIYFGSKVYLLNLFELGWVMKQWYALFVFLYSYDYITELTFSHIHLCHMCV